MKIVNLIGGIGNQMFQYAFAVALKKHFPNEDIYIDIHHFNVLFLKSFKGRNLHNGYELDKVLQRTIIPIASKKQLSKVTYYIPNYWLSRFARKCLFKRKTEYIEEQFGKYSPDVFQQLDDCYYEGYWQSAKYFLSCKEDVVDAFC